MDKPSLSIVVTSYSTARLNDICDLLDSITMQSCHNIETIFVAERSEQLAARVRLYSREKAIPNVLVLYNDGEPGLSAARNVGIGRATGDIIGFVDDDVVLFPDWAEQMLRAYQDGSVIGVTGPAFPLWEDQAMSWFPEEFYWIISCTAWCDLKEVREVRNAWGMNMSFRKDAFSRCGCFSNEYGFHKGPMAEDNEFSQRVKSQTGLKIVYSPGVKLWHKVHRYRLSQQFIKERAYWIGHSRRTLMLKRLEATESNEKTNVLSQEHQLLRRIVTRLVPTIARTFLTDPATAWRKLKLTCTVLFFVGLGYYSRLLRFIPQAKKVANQQV